MLNKIQQAIATLGFIGHLPYAPGTFGSASAFFIIILIKPGDIPLLIVSLALIILGTISSNSAEKTLGKDSGRIVIDELCGYFVSVLFIPKTFGYLLAALLLFRFFDIIKPPPVRNAEKALSGGLGIMMDDLLAGVFTNLCLQMWRYFN